jgi:hypothetical protein
LKATKEKEEEKDKRMAGRVAGMKNSSPSSTVKTPLNTRQSRGGLDSPAAGMNSRGLNLSSTPSAPSVGWDRGGDMDMYRQTRSPFIQATDKLHLDKSARYTDVGQGRSAQSSTYDQDMFQNLSGMEDISRNQEERQEAQYNRIQDSNFGRDSRASFQQYAQQRQLGLDQLDLQRGMATQSNNLQRDLASQSNNLQRYGMEQQSEIARQAGMSGDRNANADRNLQMSRMASDANDSEANRAFQDRASARADATARRGQDLSFAMAQIGDDSAKYQTFMNASQGQRYWGNW